MKKSWKTTLGGILMAIGSFLQTMDEPAWISVLGTTLVGLGGLLVGGSARDFNVSSKSTGIK